MSGGCSLPRGRQQAPRQAPEAAVELLAPASLEGIVDEWEALAARAAEPNPFYEHWMLRPALEAYARGEVACIAVRLHDGLAGVFPFERLSRYRGLPIKALRSWRHRHCMLGTPLVRAGSEAECLRALFAWAREQGIAAIEFDYARADGPFNAALVAALGAQGLRSTSFDGYARPLLRLERDAQAYVARSLSTQYRKQLRRLARRLEEHGRVEHVALGADGDAAAWLRQFADLEAAGWKGRAGSALACRAQDWRFASAVIPEAHRRGRLVALGLDVQGRPAARMCAFVAGEGSFYFKTTYEETLERFSPGVLLELDVISRVHAAPALKWMDSFTVPGNGFMERLWKDARPIQRTAVGVSRAGQLAVTLLPLLRSLKNVLRAAARGSRRAVRVLAAWQRRARGLGGVPAPGRRRRLLLLGY